MKDFANFLKTIKSYQLAVLIVDDSNISRTILVDIVKGGYSDNVDTAEDGMEALELFSSKSYDLIITDIEMPRLDGIGLTSAIREKNIIIPIVAVSATTDKEKLVQLINSGISAFIIKPFNADIINTQLYRIMKPITEKIESDKKTKQINNYVALVDESVITSSTGLDSNITYVSQAFCDISKYSKEELMGKSHNIVCHPDMHKEVYRELWETIKQDKTWVGELKNMAKDGSAYWVKSTISPVFDDSKNKIGYTAIRQDITDKKIIEEMSITDGMTGLYNRRHFNDIFPKLIAIAKREYTTVGFLVLDVDHFKNYNDTYGHQKGDEALIQIANTMKETFKRTGDMCFRLGGEEFGIVFVGNDENTASEIANRLGSNIESLHIEHSKNSASQYVTASFGLALKSSLEIDNMDELYKEADELLYKAKEGGRNRVCISSKI